MADSLSVLPFYVNPEIGDPELAVSTGRTSHLPLISLPKKKVEFDPAKSIVYPLSMQEETWCNLKAEIILRRKNSNSEVESIASSPRSTSPGRPSSKIGRIHHRFKKTLSRIRRAFYGPSDAAADAGSSGNEDDNVSRRSLSRRRDSRMDNAIRLAAKRKRLSLVEYELLEAEWSRRLLLQSQAGWIVDPDSHSQITDELMEIFEQLTVRASKRPRLDSSASTTSDGRSSTCSN